MLLNSLPNENGVFVALPPSVRDRLRPSLKRVRLEAGSTLDDINPTSDHTWFITSGIVSLLTTQEAGGIIEAAAIGREGLEDALLWIPSGDQAGYRLDPSAIR